MTAKPGSADYSSFSVLCQWAYDIKPLFDLSGSNFWPKPNVDSRAVLFTKKEAFPNCKNPQSFIKMQRALFSSRRKTVRNNLSGFLNNNELTFPSVMAAAEYMFNELHLGKNVETLRVGISKCCNNKQVSVANGYKFYKRSNKE
jgi:16S rRNA A1518/A1519 N6-dimethyltransferase RsmA/KsgA/DIM1 with predicted DNA glycosylase/AP lyase activity